MLRIAEAREARGWTQEQLAQAVGTTQQTIQRWESGQVDPKASRVLEISKALGITVTFLMGIDLDDSKPQQHELSPDERELLHLFRNMDGQGRAHVMETARMCAALTVKDGRGIRPDVAVAGIAVER